MWDSNGVAMALVADVIPERSVRGAAMSIAIALILIVVLVCLFLAAMLPVNVSFAVALIAGAIKLVFLFAAFPETANEVMSPDACQRQGPKSALRAAYGIITMNSFILRMACIAVVGGMSSVGSHLIAQPYLTGYVGMKRDQMAVMFAVIVVSVLLVLGVLAKPVIAYFGEVRTYQLCLFSVALLPATLCLCSQPQHVIIVLGVFTGPMALQIPIVSAIKSNMVSDAEQGLVQGALAALVNLASAVAAVIFGWMYNWSTDGGALQSRSAAYPSLITTSAVGLVAFLLSLSLPLKVPAPVSYALNEALLGERHLLNT